MDSSQLIEKLKRDKQIRIIEDELDVNLEIPHVAYVEIKKDNPKVLLFTNPVDRERGEKYSIPVLMNLFSSYKLTEEYLTRPVQEIADEVDRLLKMKPPTSLFGKIEQFSHLFSLRNIFPKRREGGIEKTHEKFPLNLHKLPILKTWSKDGGKFITMGQVYTHSLDGSVSNVGMYRLQVHDETHLGMHWQIHKDSTIFFNQYREANRPMPVTIAIGGDPLNTWVATAPLPHGINEMLLYGFVKKEGAKLIRVNSNYVPEDSDIIIEGLVDTSKMKLEGPFGDHTGYYTLEEEYPVLEVKSIWVKKRNPIFYATVVGKPPLEDKYMGWATERIFLPLLKTTAPDLIDYYMPENGVFHNLIIAKMKVRYRGHPQQFIHLFWGVGQMSFVKHAIFVDEKAPQLDDISKIVPYILNRFSYKDILISKGSLDALDHSSPDYLIGGKVGIDATGDEVKLPKLKIVDDEYLLSRFRIQCSQCGIEIVGVRQYWTDTQNPIAVIAVDKKGKSLTDKLPIFELLRNYCRIVVLVDSDSNDLDNPYMLVWRVVNNIDGIRDIYIDHDFYAIDGTNKIFGVDEINHQWPDDVVCDKEILESLRERGIINLDSSFIRKFQLL
ncbi:MAG TPA: menaquinone biosynthesis decarboxylase [Campylobacterales bacterium]|nr:menaquinone biosynthesis decarboxylase [Campylobacterales bacterium]